MAARATEAKPLGGDMTLKHLMAGAAMAIAAGMAAAAAHATSYTWTFSDATYSGSGTLVTDPTNTFAISGGGTLTGPSLNDTLSLFPNPTPGTQGTSPDGQWSFDNNIPVDFAGLLFTGVTNPFYNVFANGGGGSLGISFADGSVYNQDNSIVGTLTVTAVSGGVPEPATWAVMMLGFGGMGAVLRSRRKLAVAKI
jgi:hypothetical protein